MEKLGRVERVWPRVRVVEGSLAGFALLSLRCGLRRILKTLVRVIRKDFAKSLVMLFLLGCHVSLVVSATPLELALEVTKEFVKQVVVFIIWLV